MVINRTITTVIRHRHINRYHLSPPRADKHDAWFLSLQWETLPHCNISACVRTKWLLPAWACTPHRFSASQSWFWLQSYLPFLAVSAPLCGVLICFVSICTSFVFNALWGVQCVYSSNVCTLQKIKLLHHLCSRLYIGSQCSLSYIMGYGEKFNSLHNWIRYMSCSNVVSKFVRI